MGALICLLLAALLTTPAAVAYWGQRTLNDTQRYVDTVGPLVESQEVQDVLATAVTDAIQQQVDTEALLNEAFAGVVDDAPRLELLVGPLAAAIDGAVERQVGRFELADRSTIFLDEIGDLPSEAQVKLLRVLEERQIERLGSPRSIHVNTRIIAATHRNLEKQIAAGTFREDLFYRLNVFPIQVPPLRERADDIPVLVWRFVDEFSTASIARGEHIVEEFACFSCHGPEGSGGTTRYVEKRSGVTVSWAVPSLDDVFFRYEEDEVNFWVTYGRGNTPMPAWGIPGGGPLNDEQVVDVVNYLKTIQVSQEEYLGKLEPGINTALDTLAGADAAVEAAILEQSQVVAQIEAAPADAAIVQPLATSAREALDGAGTGIDTDADGLSDSAETELSAISQEAVDGFRITDPVTLDPAVADAAAAEEALLALQTAAEANPIVQTNVAAIEAAARRRL